MITKEGVVGWLATVATVSAMGFGWIYTHPVPRIAKVNLGSLYEDEKKVLASKLKPGMSESEQKAVFDAAADYGKRVDAILLEIATDCRCAIMNSAAIVQLPPGTDAGISDITDRLRAALAAK